jgi:hypothetical protein
MYHSSNRGDVGENLYAGTARLTDGRIPVDSWYNEIEDYYWNRPGTGSGVIGNYELKPFSLINLLLAIYAIINNKLMIRSFYPSGMEIVYRAGRRMGNRKRWLDLFLL